MAGILSIACTPIGNLQDVSVRTIEAMKNADVILAENIQSCRKLLKLLDISIENKKLVSCEQHNESSRIKVVLERLEEDDRIVLLSEAGAPAVSDPGGRIVEAVVSRDFDIEVLPGPSALIAGLMGAGLISHRFAFLGFLPRKGKERETLVKQSREVGLALVIFESASRIQGTLQDLFEWCGPVRVVVGRELTKHFETFHRGVLGSELTPNLITKGEMVVVVEAGAAKSPDELVTDEAEVLGKIKALIAAGSLSTKEGSRKAAKALRISNREAYQKLIKS